MLLLTLGGTRSRLAALPGFLLWRNPEVTSVTAVYCFATPAKFHLFFGLNHFSRVGRHIFSIIITTLASTLVFFGAQ